MTQFRVTIYYTEPLYAIHRGIPQRKYRGSFDVNASSEPRAIELATQKFNQAAAQATVGWPREIVDAVVQVVTT